jgi:chemotaxis protein methyltransferase CheR
MDSLVEVPLNKREFNAFRELIFEQAGISLSEAKQVLVQSRLAKRLRKLGLSDYRSYLELLKAPGSAELESFVNSLTTNKTEFFRESHHFEFLQQRVFKEIQERAACGGQRKVRLWCAASSTGEEPYSLAMSLLETFGSASNWDLKILASDIDTEVLTKAACGSYGQMAMEYLDNRYQKKYFRQLGDQYVVHDELKRLITYRKLNLNNPPWPIHTQFDAIFCRNVMIYFDSPTQRRLIDNLVSLIRPGGYLMIGHSESLLGFSSRLESLGNTIYRVIGQDETTSPPVTTLASPPADASLAAPPRRTTPKHPAPGQRNAVASEAPSLPQHSLIAGEFRASREPCQLQTTLGSCVAACLYDPHSNIGGMNHFMLPKSSLGQAVCASYGVHAMELLINELMKLGANRLGLRAKVFGGASVIGDPASVVWNIGEGNARFVKEFLKTEGIPIEAEYLGGTQGMRLAFNTHTAKATVRLLDRTASQKLVQTQDAVALQSSASMLLAESQVTLFLNDELK